MDDEYNLVPFSSYFSRLYSFSAVFSVSNIKYDILLCAFSNGRGCTAVSLTHTQSSKQNTTYSV